MGDSDAGSFSPHGAMREEAQDLPMCKRSERRVGLLWLQSSYDVKEYIKSPPMPLLPGLVLCEAKTIPVAPFKLEKGILTCCGSGAMLQLCPEPPNARLWAGGITDLRSHGRLPDQRPSQHPRPPDRIWGVTKIFECHLRCSLFASTKWTRVYKGASLEEAMRRWS